MGKKHRRGYKGAKMGDMDSDGILAGMAAQFGSSENAHISDDRPFEFKSAAAKTVPSAHRPPPPPKPQRKAKKQKLGFTKSSADKVYQENGLTGREPETHTAQAGECLAADFGESCFNQLKNAQIGDSGFDAQTHCMGQPAPGDASLIATRLQAGVFGAPTMIHKRADGYIGYDLGTSATKVAVRWTYGSQYRAFAIPVPATWQSGNLSHLWPTTVFFNPANGSFALLPEADSVRLEGFKAGILAGMAHRMMPSVRVSYAAATAAFVAMHTAYVLGAILEKYPQAKVTMLNIAIPVVAMKLDGPRFKKILSAAMALVTSADRLTLAKVENALRNAENSLIETTGVPYEMHAELVGAIAGYQASAGRQDGAHMLIDCGSATLDIATFSDRKNDEVLPVWAARVETLGADAVRAHLAAGRKEEVCRRAIDFQEHCVWKQTKKHHGDGDAFGVVGEQYGYKVIAIGGGISGPTHSAWLNKLEKTFKSGFVHPDLGELDKEQNCDDGRLIIADGLARDPFNLKQLSLPDPKDVDDNALIATAPHNPSTYH